MTPVLITGSAGFIGNHLALRYLREGRAVVGIDNLNAYYDVELKRARLERLSSFDRHRFVQMDLTDAEGLRRLFDRCGFETVINLAAQAGVRYSLVDPKAYVTSNVEGFLNILECCRHTGVRHLLYASSSSVYGAVTAMPFSVHQNVDHPVSLYAASKKANELMAHSYSHLFQIPTTGLRLFTVYGPWGRPDMALFMFTRAILAGEPIEVFNNGEMERDFTYVDDVVEAIYQLADQPARPDPQWSGQAPDPGGSYAPYRVLNIGAGAPVRLLDLIAVLERRLGKTAIKTLLPMQPGDVPATYADVEALTRAIGFTPETTIEDGVGRFVDWYRDYYGV